MDTNENNTSSEGAAGAQTASAATSPGKVHDAFQQWQESASQFVREHQRTHEDLSRLMDRPGDKISDLERKIDDVRRATETNREWIRYNRQ